MSLPAATSAKLAGSVSRSSGMESSSAVQDSAPLSLAIEGDAVGVTFPDDQGQQLAHLDEAGGPAVTSPPRMTMPSVSVSAQSTWTTTSLTWNSPVTSPSSSSALMFSVWEPSPGVPSSSMSSPCARVVGPSDSGAVVSDGSSEALVSSSLHAAAPGGAAARRAGIVACRRPPEVVLAPTPRRRRGKELRGSMCHGTAPAASGGEWKHAPCLGRTWWDGTTMASRTSYPELTVELHPRRRWDPREPAVAASGPARRYRVGRAAMPRPSRRRRWRRLLTGERHVRASIAPAPIGARALPAGPTCGRR